MRKNFADLVKIGILVPAMAISVAACSSASASEGTSSTTTSTESGETQVTESGAPSSESGAPFSESGAPEEEAVATEPAVYENKGYKITVPAALANKITVLTPADNDDGVIFDAYETKSVEAAGQLGKENMSAGWLFAISERDEETAHKILVDNFGDQQPIAKDDNGVYFIFNRPTDVRYERATVEEMQADQDDWTAACEWADSIVTSFAEDNGLTKITYNGTQIEAALAKIAYGDGVKYTISTLEHGPLEPGDVDPLPFYEKMTDGAVYESIELADSEKPDGEYVVLNFPDDEIRYDFMLGEGLENIIRMVTGPENGDQYEYYFRVTFADGTKASEVMHEWYNAIVEAQGIQ